MNLAIQAYKTEANSSAEYLVGDMDFSIIYSAKLTSAIAKVIKGDLIGFGVSAAAVS